MGREAERRALAELLSNPEVRLVTIHGPPGIGKTRLALQCASEYLGTPRFRDGVFFALLEAVSDPVGVPVALLEAMDLSLEGSEPALAQVKRQLGAKHTLFVLDNFEHLMKARGLLIDVLKVCPNVSLLVTSRERLNLEAEWVLTLEGLPVPAETQAFEDARAAHALQLFIQRARQARLDFELTADNLPHARAICQLVDGFPLGLELAAAWIGLSPLEVISRDLEHHGIALATPLSGVHERHRSIQAAFEHSWRLLRVEEQRTLRQLAVFSGGFDRPAAEAVGGASLNTLKGLVDKSLLRVDKGGRFTFHPLIRQFADEKLAELPQERIADQARHGEYYLRFLAPKYEDIMGGPYTRAALDAIEQETANLRAAWSWAVEEKQANLLLDPVASLGLYCETRSHFQLGVELLSELIAGLDEADPEHRFTLGAAYGMQGFLLIRAQSGGAALEMSAKGQAMLRPYRLPTRNWALWMALEASVGAHWARGELDEGERYVRENLALARADRDNARSDIDLRVAEVFAGISLHVLGMFETIRGHYARAIPYLEESRDLLDKHSSITLSYTLWNLGQAEFHTGALASARATLERGLELSQALGYSTMVAYILTDLARTYLALDEHGMALALCEDVVGMTQRSGDRRLQATALVILGQVLMTQNTNEALGHLRQGLAIAVQIGALECATEALAGVCTIWAREGLVQLE